MKSKTIRIFDKIVMALLGLFPFFSGCDEPREMYGTPTADYLLKGVVSDETSNNPIQNIQVVLKSNDLHFVADTVRTDSNGKYSFSFQGFPQTNATFDMKVEDVDGTANGGLYTTKETVAQVAVADWDKSDADGWYAGKATVSKDIKLSK